MPQMGVSVSEGTITRWAKQVGEHVNADETIVEISTDKVDTEVPSPSSGIVTEILVAEGETVDVGTRIAVISSGDGANAEAPATPAPAAPPPAPAPSAPAAPPAAPAPRPAIATGSVSWGVEESSPLSTIRKVIARNMRASIGTAAHVTSVSEVDMTRVVNLRKELNPQ